MAFQQTVRFDLAYGVPGDVRFFSPHRGRSGVIGSADASYNIVGQTAFFQAPSGGKVFAGNPAGDGVFYGLLCHPKNYASYGNLIDGPLGPTMTLANELNAEFLRMGYMVARVSEPCEIGDYVTYDLTTGELATVAPRATFDGVIATGVLTVTNYGGAGNIGVGSTLYTSTGDLLGRVLSLGTGTGGNGTYNVDAADTGSTGMTATSVAPAGSGLVPSCVIHDVPQESVGGGLVCVSLTN